MQYTVLAPVTCRIVVRKAKKIKGLLCSLVSAKGQYPAFILYDFQTEFLQSFNQKLIKPLCFVLVLKQTYKVGRPKEPPLESPSEPYVSLSTHTAPSPTDGNIPNFQCANKFLSLLAIAPSQCSALLLVFFFL